MSGLGFKNVRVQVQEKTSPTDYSPVSSKRTGSNGPTAKEPALITSTWGIGWQTPFLMIFCYILAIIIAFAHLLIFRYLDGKEASGPNRVAPQEYVTTLSNILANSFGFALRAALAIAFVQHMWHLFRVSAMKVSTIELLFSIRTNLFTLFIPAVIKATPLLCVLAGIMWASQVVTSFPPGAITVTNAQKETYQMVSVPHFNASYMGNGSAVEANAYSLLTLTPFMFGFVPGPADNVKDGNILNRLARQVLISSSVIPTESPCGPNCTYTTTLEGPYLTCNSSTGNVKIPDAGQVFPIYAGSWRAPPSAQLAQSRYNGTYTLAQFNTSTLLPLEANGTDITGTKGTSVLLQEDDLTCTPYRALNTITHTYNNNIYSRQIHTKPISPLVNLALLTYNGIISVGGFAIVSPPTPGFTLGTESADWSPETLAYYRDNNHMAIVTAMVSHLAGGFFGFLAPKGFRPVFAAGNYSAYELAWNEIMTTKIGGLSVSGSAVNGTVIESTLFNTATLTSSSHPLFVLTPSLLNAYLLNLTLSLSTLYSNQAPHANFIESPATLSNTISVYAFSQPLNLLLPYFITLLVSLPFIIMGGLALFRNGVSAADNSFVQILATSTGSAALERAAAGGCLGGGESVPGELKELRVKYGEIIDREEPGRVKRAGFGVEGEITHLKKGDSYGISRWI